MANLRKQADVDDDTRRRLQRERQARSRARRRGEDVPLQRPGPKSGPFPAVKTCAECGTEKPADEFYIVKPRGKNPRPHSYCKACCRARLRDERQRGVNAERLKRRYWADPEGSRAKQRQYRLDNPDLVRQRDRDNYPKRKAAERRRKYGISAMQYQTLAAAQDDVCAICGRPNDMGHGLAVDHDHTTGAVRGLLCHKCNVALGLFADDPDVMQAAIRYLADPPAPRVTGDGDGACQPLSSLPTRRMRSLPLATSSA